MKTTLYKISEDYNELMHSIEENEGVLTEDQEQQLIINKSELESKSISYLEFIRSREGFLTTVNDEIKRLQTLKKRNTTLIDTLKNNLVSAVNLFGEFTVGTVTFGTRKSESVTVDDINSLPKEYKTIKVTELANKEELKKAIQRGEDIDGVTIQTNFNLKIK